MVGASLTEWRVWRLHQRFSQKGSSILLSDAADCGLVWMGLVPDDGFSGTQLVVIPSIFADFHRRRDRVLQSGISLGIQDLKEYVED